MYERPRGNVKVERSSTFSFTRDLPYIVSILLTRVKFTCVSTQKLRDSGNLYLKPDQLLITPFGWSLLVRAIQGSTPRDLLNFHDRSHL